MKKSYNSVAAIIGANYVMEAEELDNGNVIAKLKNVEYEYSPVITTLHILFWVCKFRKYHLIKKTQRKWTAEGCL